MFRAATIALKTLSRNQRNLKRFATISWCQLPEAVAAASRYRLQKCTYSSAPKQPTEHVVDSILDHATYERVCSDTLDGLNDYFEQLLESVENIPGSDLAYSVS